MGTSPGRSLWSLIAEHTHVAEMPGIRAALGRSLVDMYTEVHTEAQMWHRICCEVKQSGRDGTPRPRGQGCPLADPPVEKELLRAEVKMLLQTLKERASRDGRDDGDLLSQYKQKTVNYALGHRDSCSSNCTNPPDADNGSRLSSPCPAPFSAEDEIVALRDKLTVTEIDQVVEQLRSVFMKETKVLIRLTDYIKEDIRTQKSRGGCESHHSEPSLADLRELREALQMDLELSHPSSAAFPPNKDLKKSLRLPAEQSIKTLTHSSIPRPHLLSPLSHKPRPPNSPPPTKASPSRTSRHHRITSAPSALAKTSDRMDSSALANIFPSAPPAHSHSVSKRQLKSVQEAEAETPLLTGFHLTARPARVPN